jgi:hypothetical protein
MAARGPSAARASIVSHMPTAVSLTTTDLRAKLERRHSGEDGRTTIDRQRERHRNLDGDYDAANVVPGTANAAHTSTSSGSRGGCMALAPHLQMVVWPCKVQPHFPEKYDRSVNPSKFLQIYFTSILAVGGNEAVMANYFPVALTGTTRLWLMNLNPRVSVLLGRVVPSIYGQLQEHLRTARQRGRPPCRTSAPGGVTVILHPAVLSCLKHHSLYLQRFYCCRILTGRVR